MNYFIANNSNSNHVSTIAGFVNIKFILIIKENIAII